jgi:hypothetical protein
MQCCLTLVRELFGKVALFPKRFRTVPEGSPNKILLSANFTEVYLGSVVFSRVCYCYIFVHFESSKKDYFDLFKLV